MALPIAWAYSHMKNALPAECRVGESGFCFFSARSIASLMLSPSWPRPSSHSTEGYMVESTSASMLPRSQWIGRVGSSCLTAAIVSMKPGPWPVSLPIDQSVTAGWLR